MKLMMSVCSVLAALAIVCMAMGQGKDEAEKDLDKMQGSWRVVSWQMADEKKAGDEVKKMNFTVKRNTLIYDTGVARKKGEGEGTIKLDPKTKALDWTLTDLGATVNAIYELKDDDLKIGFGNDSPIRPQRPTRMVMGKEDVVWLLVLKREKPKDPPKKFTNSIGMKFVWIPPGNFMMGSPKEEKGRGAIENQRGAAESQHTVTLTQGFYMGVYAVTQEEWQAVMENNPSHFKGEKNLPVETVSWDDCQEFIKKLREKENKSYRLPTEAEWEYACRAGTTTPFHFGETISSDQANYLGTAVYGNGKQGKFRGKTTPVGSFPANGWGLHDMHGNMQQWCHDWYGDYPQKDVVDPQGPDSGQYRVLRGGSFDVDPLYCRSANRSRDGSGYRFSSHGFRLCFSVE